MGNKLIVYSAGDYRHRKGGWCYISFLNEVLLLYGVGLGVCDSESRSQTEIIALSKALEDIEEDDSINVIELHSNNMDMCGAIKKYFSNYSFDFIYVGRGERYCELAYSSVSYALDNVKIASDGSLI